MALLSFVRLLSHKLDEQDLSHENNLFICSDKDNVQSTP